jgi:hypothetical protein
LNIDLKNKKILTIVIVLIVIAIVVYAYYKIVYMYRNNVIFAKQSEQYLEEVSNPVFKLEKILIYSDANIEDLSSAGNLSDINISQYTDFAIYINNKLKTTELTEENTINNISINNISITKTSLGDQKVFYKDINDLCKYKKIEQGVSELNFSVIHTNSEKNKTDLSNTFYTDCSEPIIISYVNENIVENKNVSNTQEILSLDGSMLKYLNINLDNLNYRISFTINIENNLGEKFYCNVSQDIDLNSSEGGIYTGYIMQIRDLTEYDYKFRKV